MNWTGQTRPDKVWLHWACTCMGWGRAGLDGAGLGGAGRGRAGLGMASAGPGWAGLLICIDFMIKFDVFFTPACT